MARLRTSTALSSLTGFAVLASPAIALAASAEACSTSRGGFLGFPTWYKYLKPTFKDPDGSGPLPSECALTFNFPADVSKILIALVEILLRVGVLVAIGFIIYGAFQYLISQGEPDKLTSGRKTITNALIGLVITVTATAIVNFVGGRLS